METENPFANSSILLVDDSPDICELFKLRLEKSEYMVYTVNNGKDALDIIETLEPDLILLDLNMPEMDGYEVCRQVRANKETTALPILFLTSMDEEAHRIEALKIGADDFLSKKIKSEELNARINTKLRISKLNTKLLEANKKISRELESAKAVQLGIIPEKIPEINGISTSTELILCEQVGGDYYDIIKKNQEKSVFLIADVSGHDIAAAFISGMAKIAFTSRINSFDSLSEIFDNVNNDLKNVIRTYHFITAFMVELNTKKREFKYSTAGHFPQFYYNKKESRVDLLKGKGHILGVFDDVSYKEETISYNSKDKLILFTDGLFENRNSKEERYSQERLQKLVEENAHLSVDKLKKTILENHWSFSKDCVPEDDICIIIIEFS